MLEFFFYVYSVNRSKYTAGHPFKCAFSKFYSLSAGTEPNKNQFIYEHLK